MVAKDGLFDESECESRGSLARSLSPWMTRIIELQAQVFQHA